MTGRATWPIAPACCYRPRQFDFSRLFDMIVEEDIGTQRLAAERSMDILGEMEICCGPARRSVRRAQRPSDSGSNTHGRQANEPITEIAH
jgi:hypothetical protein